MIGMVASTDYHKMRLMSHGAYIKIVTGTDDLLRLIVSCSAVTNMSLELFEDSHTNRHKATQLSILAPSLSLPGIMLPINVFPSKKMLLSDKF